MPRKVLIDRFQFSIAEVARTMLADLVEDCHSWEIRVEAGLVYIDVIEPASASQAAGEDDDAAGDRQSEAAKTLAAAGILVKGNDDGTTTVTVHADRISVDEDGGVAASFEAETNAAADAETKEEETDGDADPFWDSEGGEANDQPAETTVDGHKPKKPASLAQLAGILCNEGAFQKWIFANDKDEAAVKLREKCGVESRADLDKDAEAGAKFRALRAEYNVWLNGD